MDGVPGADDPKLTGLSLRYDNGKQIVLEIERIVGTEGHGIPSFADIAEAMTYGKRFQLTLAITIKEPS